MTKSNENSYRSILKGTSAFGAVQILNLLIGVVRGKLVAIFLGPAGMGISALFSTAAITIQQFASLGLNLAFVKEVAATREDSSSLSHTLAVARRLILFTALLGATVCLLGSPLLSKWTFGSYDHTLGFMALSLMVFFSIAGAGMLSLLQGLRQVKRLSLASIVGGASGLLIGVPLYWLFGEKGIVPALIAVAFSTALFYFFSLRDARLPHAARFSWSEHRPMIKRLVAMGVILMAGALIGSLTNYLINTFVRTFGSVTDVGLYQAANSITNQYVGVVFTAMSLDFFPRLSAVASDNRKMTGIVNRQINIVVMLLAPLVILLITTTPLIIRLLLTEEFYGTLTLMRWMGLGILLRGIIYPMGYISFAKDNRRLFFWLEGITGNLLNLILSCGFFFAYGVDGLGISLVASCGLTFFIYYAVNRHFYHYHINRRTLLLIVIALITGTASFLLTMLTNTTLSIILNSLLFIAVAIPSAIILRRNYRKS